MANTQKVKTGFVASGSSPCSWQDSLPILPSWDPSQLEVFTPLHCKDHRALESGLAQLTPAGLAKFMEQCLPQLLLSSRCAEEPECAWCLVTSGAAVPPWIFGSSSCYNLLSWPVLLWLLQRPPHTSLDPLKILTQQVWLGGKDRVITVGVKSDPSFTALTFACCCLHNNCKMKGEPMTTGWHQENPWKCLHLLTSCSSLTHPQELWVRPHRNGANTSEVNPAYYFFWEIFIAVVCNLKLYIRRIQEIKLIFILPNSVFSSGLD